MSSKKLEGALQLLSSLIKTPSCSPTSSLAHRPRLPVFLLLDPPSTLLQLLPATSNDPSDLTSAMSCHGSPQRFSSAIVSLGHTKLKNRPRLHLVILKSIMEHTNLLQLRSAPLHFHCSPLPSSSSSDFQTASPQRPNDHSQDRVFVVVLS